MKNITVFVSENFKFLEEKFSIYLNRRVFVMVKHKDVHSHIKCLFIFQNLGAVVPLTKKVYWRKRKVEK